MWQLRNTRTGERFQWELDGDNTKQGVKFIYKMINWKQAGNGGDVFVVERAVA
jgi:hypothetical protein